MTNGMTHLMLSRAAVIAVLCVAFVVALACGRDSSPSPTAVLPSSGLTSDSPTATVGAATSTPQAIESLTLFDYDRQAPLGIQEISSESLDGVAALEITYVSPRGGVVPASLVVPDGSGPYAGVILQHGVPGDRRSLHPYAIELAMAGAVVLLIDAPFVRPANADRVEGAVTYTEQDREEQIQLIVDLRRGVDVLTSLSEVDADRIGYIGVDYGAAMGGLLAGVETRIKAYVLATGYGGVLEYLCNVHGESTTPWGPASVKAEVAPNTFYHVALVFDQPEGEIRGYLDGQDIGVGKLFAHGSDVNIGVVGDTTAFHDRDNSSGHVFKGLVDEVALYGRALTSDEIQAIFDAGGAGPQSSAYRMPADLVSLWPGNGNANDIVGSNPGTLRNGTGFATGVIGQAFELDGVNDSISIRSSADINTGGPYSERTLGLWFRTSDDVSTRQVLWEEGGYLRGLSIYVDGGFVYVNGWNLINDDTPPACHLPLEQEQHWVSAMEPIEPIHFVGNAAPAALLFQGALDDQLVRNEDAVRFQEAGSEPKLVKWYDSGHGLNDAALFDQVEWLQTQIGIDPTGFYEARTIRQADDLYPRWSPDGQRIVYMSDGDGMFEIYAMDADGTNPTNLTHNQRDDHFPDWSPDGSKIAYMSTRDGIAEIYVMDADGANQRRITSSPATDSFPRWFPDGSKIALTSNRTSFVDVFVMNSNGTELKNLTQTLTPDYSPAWSPDGTKIAYTSRRDDNGEVYVMNADGTKRRNLSENPEDDFFPAWSPDGSMIVFTSLRDGNHERYIMRADGSEQVRLTNYPGLDAFPDWSPDGMKIAFVSMRDGDADIFVMNVDGSGLTNLTRRHG